MMARRRSGPAAGMVLGLALALGGCSARPGLPFTAGTGRDSYQLDVELADAYNLVPNAEVKVADVTVGTVTRIRQVQWHARLTLSLPDSVRLPANSRATVGQKSLLGAMYLSIDPPATKPSAIMLKDHDVIGLRQTGAYPATEDVLIALSTVLNGSGLSRLKTITTELNRSLDGRTDDARELLENLSKAAKQLSSQRKDITTLLERLAGLTDVMRREGPRVDRNLASLGPGLAALDKQRPQLVRTVQAINGLDRVLTPLLVRNQNDLATELRQLRLAVSALADAGNDLPDALNVAGTVLFPLDAVDRIFHGDYGNLYLQVDLRLKTLLAALGSGTPPIRGASTTAQLLSPVPTQEGTR